MANTCPTRHFKICVGFQVIVRWTLVDILRVKKNNKEGYVFSRELKNSDPYSFFGSLSSTPGANLDILEDKNFTKEDKFCQKGDKITKEEIKKFQSLVPWLSHQVCTIRGSGGNDLYD